MTTDHTTAPEPIGLATTHKKLPREALPHSHKFRMALGALFGMAVGALLVAVVVLANNNGAAAPKAGHWSAWAPADDGAVGSTEIATHIGPLYRLDKKAQLDTVTPLPVTQFSPSGVSTGSGPTVVVNTGGAVVSSSSLELLTGNIVAYNVCGLGASGKCDLAGTPSTYRMLLLRREALELALYTFKYISDSQNVVVVLPPSRPAKGSTAAPQTISVLFVRKELQPLLDVPLSQSLKTPPPAVAELPVWSQSDEATLVNEATGRGMFSSQVEKQQEGGKLLILSPLNS